MIQTEEITTDEPEPEIQGEPEPEIQGEEPSSEVIEHTDEIIDEDEDSDSDSDDSEDEYEDIDDDLLAGMKGGAKKVMNLNIQTLVII